MTPNPICELNMTKTEIIDQIAKKTAVAKKDISAVIDELGLVILREVKAARSIRITGLGTFSLRKTKARTGINPKTKEKIKIPARKKMAFKASSTVGDHLNPNK